LNGPSSLLLYAAARDFHPDRVQTQAALADCDLAGVCISFATATVDFTGANQFTGVTFDFGSQTRSFATSHRLELWIIVTKASQRDMWMAYDTVGYESALTITT
jgi:hypothetical protein